MDMDFFSINKKHTHELFSEINQNEIWTGWGIGKFILSFETFVKAVISIAGAIVLTISLFTAKVPEEPGRMTIFNSPVFILGIIFLLMVVTILAPLCKNKAQSYWVRSQRDTNEGNRFFGFFGFMGQECSRALDIRIYEQQFPRFLLALSIYLSV